MEYIFWIFILVLIVLFIKIYLAIKRKINFFRSDIRKVDKMNGHEFEMYLEHLFKRLGYKAKKTKGSGDYGVDLLLQRDKVTIAVQAKRYKNKVNLKAVQEVVGGKGYYNADEAWVITNSFFTKSAQELAHKNGVKLINRNDLIKIMVKR